MKPILFAFFGLTLSAALHSPADALPGPDGEITFFTAPAQLVAGQPFSLVFNARTLSGPDEDPSTIPVASVNELGLSIELNSECTQIFCDSDVERAFRVEVDGLPAGVYPVRTSTTSSFQPALFTLNVENAAPAPGVLPAEGAWTQQDNPGTGMFLQQRGALLSVALFDWEEPGAMDVPQLASTYWMLDVVPMRNDSVALLMATRGVPMRCFGCVDPLGPRAGRATEKLRLRFESARRAYADLTDGTTVPLVSFPFGVSYLPTRFPDLLDAEFGPLPLPDLAGRWALFGADDADVESGSLLQFADADLSVDGEASYSSATLRLHCKGMADERGAGCDVFDEAIGGGDALAFAALGDITEQRIRMVDNDGGIRYLVRAPELK